MKQITIIAAVGLAAFTLPSARALEFDFATTGNSQLVFTGESGNHMPYNPPTISIANSTLNDATKGFGFEINNSINDPSVPTATGLMGILTGGFSISGYMDSVAGGVHTEIATLTAVGTPVFMIMDAGYNPSAPLGVNDPVNANHIYKSTPSFDTITQVYMHTGHGNTFLANGVSDSALTLNLSTGTYTGHEADLIGLATQGATIQLGWSWNGLSLGQMIAHNAGVNKVSLNGSIQSNAAVPDGVNTVWLMGLAIAGLAYAGRRAGFQAA